MGKPSHCRPGAYKLFAEQLPVLDTTEGLMLAAIAIACHQLEDVEPELVEQRIEGFAEAVRSRLRSQQPKAILSHLHEVLFDIEGFTGNEADYYNPLNSYLPVVVETNRGIPITLTLIYKCVAERVGLQVRGLNAPGHFLANVEVGGEWWIIDPFAGGRTMSAREAAAKVQEIAGLAADPGEEILVPASHRQWIARMLHNLEAIFAHAGRTDDVVAMQELLAVLE